jgi:hypothetical protein
MNPRKNGKPVTSQNERQQCDASLTKETQGRDTDPAIKGNYGEDLGILKWYERCQKRNGIANERNTPSSLPFGSVSSGSTLHFARRRFGASKPTLVNFGDQASGRNQRKSLDKLHPHLRLNLQSLVPNTIPDYSVSPPSSFPPHITFTSCPQLQLPARLQQPKPSQQTRTPSP